MSDAAICTARLDGRQTGRTGPSPCGGRTAAVKDGPKDGQVPLVTCTGLVASIKSSRSSLREWSLVAGPISHIGPAPSPHPGATPGAGVTEAPAQGRAG